MAVGSAVVAPAPERDAPAWLEIAMLVLALLMLPLVIAEETTSDRQVELWAERISAAIWFAFVVEYLVLFSLARSKRTFVITHWFDLAIIVFTPPVALIPDQFDALRILRALRALRLLRALAVVARAQHTLRRYMRRDSALYLLLFTAFVVVIGGLAIHALEPETAKSVGDGIWWSAVTLSTVGYGDIAPTTGLGRTLAIGLVIVGVGTFATLTASIASLFVEANPHDDIGDLKALRAEIAGLREDIRALRSSK